MSRPQDTYELRNALNRSLISRHQSAAGAGKAARAFAKRIERMGGCADGCSFDLLRHGVRVRRGSEDFDAFERARAGQ